MAFSEVYQALQTGVVDGQENTWSNIYTQKMYEADKSTSPTPTMATSGMWWLRTRNSGTDLPPDVRAACEKAMKEATEYGNGQSAKENQDALAEINKMGKSEIAPLTPEQDLAMRKALDPVYQDVA